MESEFLVPSLELLTLVKDAPQNDKKLKEYLIENEMGHLYKKLCENGSLADEKSVYEKIIKKNDEKLKEIESVQDTEKKRNLNYDRMVHLGKIGNLDELARLNESPTVNTSVKMDVYLYEIRTGLILRNSALISDRINKGLALIEKNCDWDRRNKFKVYQGLIHMLKYEYKQAADLFTSTLATFQCNELFSFEEFIKYTIFCSVIAYDRKQLQEKILKSTDILEMRNNCKTAFDLVQTIQSCYYVSIFKKLVEFCEENTTDLFIGDKLAFFINEVKIRSYNQLLESYSSIRIQSMAETFCVSEEYLENDLNHFIVNERLYCMIDKIDKMVLVRECERTFSDKMSDLSNQVLNYVEKQTNK
ncbi:26S proteasome regulatory complex, subunit RPN7/PSMD6 [Pseudoloma neurophilia]|uniref:26S proteasome regulatory complex, subunit RPN7/PSMD6 n=1 Tax=Pseudoloma neurophilia TaxID=146866 RepID=A0A0R0LZQ3_9MICR|nr:26S proteasome regulatory complex, subunit RPN7/PSMD6 [Pseudoloma neurophilia]